MNQLKTFDSSYFIRKSHFEEDGTQNYLVLHPIHRYFKVFSITQYLEYVSEWKSEGLSNYGIGFDRRGSFSFPDRGFGLNVIIFGADMRSSAHIDNKKKYILVLGIGPIQGLEHTLTAEKMYSISCYEYKILG